MTTMLFLAAVALHYIAKALNKYSEWPAQLINEMRERDRERGL